MRRRRIKERRAALVLLVAALALAPVAANAADPTARPVAAASPPPRLVVGLRLGDPALQAGVVRQGEVVLARGLEIELVRTLARRLGTPIDRFVEMRRHARLPVAYPARWSLALGSIEAPRSGGAAGLSVPYLPTGAVVVLSRGSSRPRGLADLRSRVLCAVRHGGAADAISQSVRPGHRPLLAKDDAQLLTLVRTGACEAAFVPAVRAGRFVRGHAGVLGPVGGLVPDGKGLVVAVSHGDGPTVAEVDRVLRRLRADGTLGRLARSWLGLDPAALRVLR